MIIISRLTYELYLFQLENYNLSRYVKLALRTLFRVRKERRQELRWTLKAKLIMGIALAAYVVFALGLARGWWILALLALGWIIFPLFLIFAAIVLAVPEFFARRYIISRAKRKLAQFPQLKVIGIAGSYGKTTVKEMIAGILSERYSVLKTPETVNTPLGIADLVMRELDEKTQIFVVEMGEHTPGDIRAICNMVHPHIGVITGINEAHLERMGNIENTVHTIFELAEGASDELILNVDDELVFKNYNQWIDNKKFVGFYSAAGANPCEYFPRSVVFRGDGSGYSFELEKNQKIAGRFETPLLGQYSVGVVVAGILAGTAFGMDMKTISDAVKKVKPPKHRLELVPTANGVIVIDDGYNGNPAGAAEAVRVLSKFEGRRKIYVTPGLVEMGSAKARVHEALGRELASVADVIVLIKNSVTDDILKGLGGGGFKSENIKIFNTAAEAHGAIGEIVKPGDVVLFQNDWPDNYL